MKTPNALELVRKHGIKWFCDRYKPKNHEEELVLDYLLQDEYAIKYYTMFLSNLDLKPSQGELFQASTYAND